MMNHNQDQLVFLKKKMSELKLAIFKADIRSELKLPNNIIRILKVDDDGTIWFFTSCLEEQAPYIDKSFHADLDFFRKGATCHLQLSGNATIVEDDSEAFLTVSNFSRNLARKLVLIKMKMIKADYFEHKTRQATSFLESCKLILQDMFPSDTHRQFNFS